MLKKILIIGLTSVIALGSPVASVNAADTADIQLLEQMDASLKEKSYYEGTINIDMPISIASEGITAEIPVNIKGNFKIDTDNKKAAINVDLASSILGQDENNSYNVYISDDMLYISENGDGWRSETLGNDYSIHENETPSIIEILPQLLLDENLSKDFSINGDTVKRNKMECYEIRYSMPAGTFMNAFNDIIDGSFCSLDTENDNVADITLYIGIDDSLPYGVDFSFNVFGEMDEDIEGAISCNVNAKIDIINFKPQEIIIPQEVTETDQASIYSETIPSSEESNDFLKAGTIIYVDTGDAANTVISFKLPIDMKNTTYDKTLKDYFYFDTANGNFEVETDEYNHSEENIEFDRDFYTNDNTSLGLIGAEEFNFNTPNGEAFGIFFKSITEDIDTSPAVSYTAAHVYIDIDNVCYKFSYTVYEDAEPDDLKQFLEKTLDSIEVSTSK